MAEVVEKVDENQNEETPPSPEKKILGKYHTGLCRLYHTIF